MLTQIIDWLFGRPEPEPRIVNHIQLMHHEAVVGDLVPFIGGCPRIPGDQCDLVGGYKSVICEYRGEIYYKIVA
jgi:hypothetical protein